MLSSQPAPVKAVHGHHSLEVSYPVSVTQVGVCRRALGSCCPSWVRDKQRTVGSSCRAHDAPIRVKPERVVSVTVANGPLAPSSSQTACLNA